MPQTFYPSKEEFEHTIERTFEQILSDKLPALIREATAKQYLTIAETCELLDVSRRHLQYLRSSGQISFIKNGRKVYFRREDLQDYFDQNLIQKMEEPHA